MIGLQNCKAEMAELFELAIRNMEKKTTVCVSFLVGYIISSTFVTYDNFSELIRKISPSYICFFNF